MKRILALLIGLSIGYIVSDAISFYYGSGSRVGFWVYHYAPKLFWSGWLDNTPYGPTRIHID